MSRSFTSALRSWLQTHLPTFYNTLRIAGQRRLELFPPRVTYAITGLHEKIKSHFCAKPGLFFEVGANNGHDASNTAYLEKYCGWTGILVEAMPHKYVECMRNCPASSVVHAALVPFDYDRPFVEIIYSNLMSITTLSDIAADSHVAAGADFLASERKLSGTIFLAPARTVDAILAEQGYPAIDFFSLDVEGAELQVLRGIDFSRTRPRNFLIEARDPDAISLFLAEKGYRLAERWSYHDYLFVDDRT